jgi:hypothetical protein
MKSNIVRLSLTAGFVSFALFACAHERNVTPEQIAASQSPLRAAEEAGAAKIPAAALYLKLAKDEIKMADEMGEKGDEREAMMRARAAADAELALALAQDKTMADQATTALEQVKTDAKTN